MTLEVGQQQGEEQMEEEEVTIEITDYSVKKLGCEE